MITNLNREEFSTKKQFLDFLYNNLGETNLRVFYAWREGEEKKFSKWVRYEDILHNPERYTWILDKCNNRTILKCEIVIDIDEASPFDSLKEKLDFVLDDLKNKRMYYSPYCSNKGYHVHIIFPELIDLKKNERQKIREGIIEKYGSDLHLASDNAPIALEGEAHWKSGKIKRVMINE